MSWSINILWLLFQETSCLPLNFKSQPFCNMFLICIFVQWWCLFLFCVWCSFSFFWSCSFSENVLQASHWEVWGSSKIEKRRHYQTCHGRLEFWIFSSYACSLVISHWHGSKLYYHPCVYCTFFFLQRMTFFITSLMQFYVNCINHRGGFIEPGLFPSLYSCCCLDNTARYCNWNWIIP